MTLLIRSTPTGVTVWSTPSRCCPAPGPSSIAGSSGGSSAPSARGCVGSQSTNCSPISDISPTRQRASVRNGKNAGSSMRRTTTALLSSVKSSESIAPTSTPATFTSSPAITKLALSNTARTR